MDAWLIAQGAEILASEQLKAVVRKISWANVPGENPGDADFLICFLLVETTYHQ